MIQAIVYTSHTGTTAQYAKMLGEKTGLPVYPLEQALKVLPAQTEILYLGWLMASMVKGYSQAAKRFRVTGVCGVCLGTTGSQLDQVRQNNRIPQQTAVFTLQGGFDLQKLRGVYKMMMKMMTKVLTKEITSKPEQTDQDRQILQMLHHGGSAVSEQHLTAVLQWLQA